MSARETLDKSKMTIPFQMIKVNLSTNYIHPPTPNNTSSFNHLCLLIRFSSGSAPVFTSITADPSIVNQRLSPPFRFSLTYVSVVGTILIVSSIIYQQIGCTFTDWTYPTRYLPFQERTTKNQKLIGERKEFVY